MNKADWVWMPHAAHFIMGPNCQFHLATYVNGYLISTVGELWCERAIREIHARVHDPRWLDQNIHLLGDNFDSAYFKRFGFEDIGYQRKYETMVFMAEPNYEHRCCQWKMASASEIDGDSYNDAADATEGHMALCEKYAMKELIADA